MKKITGLLLGLILPLMSVSCIRETYPDDTPVGTFEALWRIMDENYCYFDYKNVEYGLDWDEVHDRYSSLVRNGMDDQSLFKVLCDMLGELRDGHVNLITAFDYGRNWSWQEDFPVNYYEHIRNNYLGTDYRIAGGFRYTVLDGNIGYIYYGSFSNTASNSALDCMLDYFSGCSGIIFDVRSNGGGVLMNVDRIISRFIGKDILCGYLCHKTGPGHSDFSGFEKRIIHPSAKHLRWEKPVAVLSNRGCFSAANTFVSDMRYVPQSRIFGDRTGGGGGIPLSSELPNGWSVRYSSSPMLDADGNHIESGIMPDESVSITDSDFIKGVDTIIEAARQWIQSMNQ